MTPPVWFITGCSSGFGRQIAITAAKSNHTVVATSRNLSKLEDLAQLGIITKKLDVRSSDEDVKAVIEDVLGTVGRIDILVNNAGYILEGAIEECSAQEAEEVFATNVFGQLRVLRAVLPSMRAQKSGVIANLGSKGGWAGVPAAGLYCATKAAIAIYTESLRAELTEFGIETTCVEPGYFRTNFLTTTGGHRVTAKTHIPALEPVTGATRSALAAYNQNQPGDPVKGAKVIFEALTKTGPFQGRSLPPRLALGRDAVQTMEEVLKRNREAIESWQDVISLTDCDDVQN